MTSKSLVLLLLFFPLPVFASDDCGILADLRFNGVPFLGEQRAQALEEIVREYSALPPGPLPGDLREKVARAIFLTAFQAAQNRLGDPHIALDIAQESVLRVLSRLDSRGIPLSSNSGFLSLVAHITRQKAADHLRRERVSDSKFGNLDPSEHASVHPINQTRRWRNRWEAIEDRDPVDERARTGEEHMTSFLVSEMLQDAFDRLNDTERAVVEAHLLSGKTHEAIAADLKMSERTVHRYYASGLGKMRTHLAPRVPAPWRARLSAIEVEWPSAK